MKELDNDPVLEYGNLYPSHSPSEVKRNSNNPNPKESRDQNRHDSYDRGEFDVDISPMNSEKREQTRRRNQAYFGKKIDKKPQDKEEHPSPLLEFDLLYPSPSRGDVKDNNSNNAPKESKDHSRPDKADVMHSDEEFEFKDEPSDSDSERTKPRRQRRDYDEVIRDSPRRNSKSASASSMTESHTASTDYGGFRGYPGSQDCTSISQGFPNVLTAYKNGLDNDFIQCVIVRDRNGFQAKVFPNYELRLQETNKVLIIAKKMNMNRTSNYHLFDMTRGQVGRTLTKKSGNYIGKLRAKNLQRTEYILLNNAAERQEVAGFMFDRADSLVDTKDGIKPRRLSVILPRLSPLGLPVPNRADDDDIASSIIEILRDTSSDKQGMNMFETK